MRLLRYFIYFVLLTICGCFGRGSLAPETNSVSQSDVLLLEGRAHVSGRILADENLVFRTRQPSLAAVTGARVELEESGEAANCDENGRFRFLNILPGDYHLRGYRRLSDGRQALVRRLLRIDPGIQELPTSLALEMPGGLAGKVQATAALIPSLFIEVDAPGGGRPLDADGSWQLDGLAPGTYQVRLHREGYRSLDLGQFAIPAGGILQLPESLPPLTPTGSDQYRLTVSVMDGSSRPLSGVWVWLDGNGRGGWTDDDGRLRFDGLAARRLTLHARASGYREATRAVSLASPEENLQLTLVSGGYQGQARLRVRVRDSVGQGLAGVRVRLLPETLAVITDAAGQALLPADTGSSEVFLVKEGYASQQDKVYLNPGEIVIRDYTMANALPAVRYQVSGLVRDGGDNPQANRIVRELYSGYVTRSGEDGRFLLRLPSGIRVLAVEDALGRQIRQTIDLQSDRSDLTMTLP